jgi:micrococcal nuclease
MQIKSYLSGWLWWLRLLIGIGCCCLLLGCQAAIVPQGTRVQVAQVVSGQTLEVLDLSQSAPQTERVRLLGIEAPDLAQAPWGALAKTRLAELVAGQTVLLESDVEAQDDYARRLAYIWQNGTLLNEQLVAEGQALAKSRSPNTKYEQRLAHAQEKARLLGLGIWNPSNPMRQTPGEFRQQHPSP